MDTVETVKAKIKAKIKELEALKKRIPRKCGDVVHNVSVELWLKVEELEDEIERLKKELLDARM